MIELLTLGRVRLATEGDAARNTVAQPKRIALLAYLAVTGTGAGRRRDELLAMFWPELGDEEARRALRQALHYLRRLLGDGGPEAIITEGDEVGVGSDALRCDAVTFEEAVQRGDADAALSLYHGEFLQGFHVPDVSTEYEEWVDRTRARLRRKAAAIAWTASEAAEHSSNRERAVDLARRACQLELDEESGWRRLMSLQDRLGDRAAALRSYEELRQKMERDLGVRPAAETIALAQAIRSSNRVARPPETAAQIQTPSAALELRPVAETPATTESEGASPPAAVRRQPRYLAAAGVLLLVAVAGFAAVRAARRDHRDTPSLVSAGTLSPRDKILVGDFVDQAHDSALATVVTQAIRVDLTQSPLVVVMSPRQLNAALARMQRPAGAPVDDSIAREIALREGAKAYVTGSVAKVGGAYTISAQLVGSAKGDPLVAVRETAADSTQVISAIDRASKQLRYRIGESLKDLRDMPALNQVTTASLPALRKYTEGYQLFLAGRRTEALRLLEESTAIDTGFSTAYRTIASIYGAMDEPGRSRAAGEHAMANKDRLPFAERQFLLAGTAYGAGDYETTIRMYEQYLARFPGQASALSNMALAYRDWRRYAQAESVYHEAIHADSTIAVIYYGLHSVQAFQGKFADSRATLDEISRRFPGDQTLSIVEVQDAAARQAWEEAERRAEANIAAQQGDTLRMVDAFEQMAGIVETQGRLAEAEKYWRTQLRLSAASGSSSRHLYGMSQLGLIELRYRGRPARAKALMDSSLMQRPLDKILPGDRPYYELARFYAIVGDVARARALLASAEDNDKLLGLNRPAERSWTNGVIALANGQASEAEADLRQAAETHTCPVCVLPDLARAYEAVHKPQAALITYEHYANTPWLWRYETDATELGFALQRIGELYTQQRDKEKATAAYEQLARLWRRADPELQALVAGARKHGV
jgi:DNA-binding SARP family transcriptional activator/tetratricopeptide (TPR) repeat protein